VNQSLFASTRNLLLGKPKNPLDPRVFHQISLIAFLAWVGLGADGLSSSAYGPEEAYLALREHFLLALPLAILMALTVFIISASYSQIIELFPTGGGGYLVATKLLGQKTGLVSGSALVVDYMLTITISVASGADALFSFLPAAVHGLKLVTESVLIFGLIFLNLRGTKESVQFLLPIFLLFVLMHATAISLGIGTKLGDLPLIVSQSVEKTVGDIHGIGIWATLAILLHAYSLGGGTYTGIEAVSNGLQVLREPRVDTGKRTMLYMAVSLAFTASGILLCYLLHRVASEPGKTLNASLLSNIYGAFGRNAGHRSSTTTGGGTGRFHRWPASAFQYGSGLMGAAPIFSIERSSGHPRRNLVYGAGVDELSSLQPGRRSTPRGHVQHQCLSHLHVISVGHVQALVGGAQNRIRMAAKTMRQWSGIVLDGDHSGSHGYHQIR
jgi:Amino acid permease